MSTRFSKPQASTYFKAAEQAGALVIFEPLSLLSGFVFPGSKDAPRDAYRANVYVVSGPNGEQRYFDQTITQSVLVNGMRGATEKYLLGRLEMGDRAWLLKPASDADEKAAGAFLDDLEAGGSATPAGAKADDGVPF